MTSKLKFEKFFQQGKEAERKRDRSFFGLINKADYEIKPFATLTLWPKFKSIYRRQLPSIRAVPRELSISRDREEILFLVSRYNFLPQTWVDIGLEFSNFDNLKDQQNLRSGEEDDFNSFVVAFVFSNTSAYNRLQTHPERRVSTRTKKLRQRRPQHNGDRGLCPPICRYRRPLMRRKISTLAAFALIQCGGPSDVADNVAARIGDKEITREDLTLFAAETPALLRSEATGMDAAKDYLQTLIDMELMLVAARAKGLDKEAQFTAQWEQEQQNRIVKDYIERHVLPESQPSEQEVREQFAKSKWSRLLKLAHIRVETQQQAQQVVQELEQGRPFAAVAAETLGESNHGGQRRPSERELYRSRKLAGCAAPVVHRPRPVRGAGGRGQPALSDAERVRDLQGAGRSPRARLLPPSIRPVALPAELRARPAGAGGRTQAQVQG